MPAIHIEGHPAHGPNTEDRAQVAADLIGILSAGAETGCDQKTLQVALKVYRELTPAQAGVEGTSIVNSNFTGIN